MKKEIVKDQFVRNDSFRIWDINTRSYVENSHVVTGQDGELYRIVMRGVIELIPLDSERYKKERFIDKDKNGKRIFEKDLLRVVDTGELIQLRWDMGQLAYYVADECGFVLSYAGVNNYSSVYLDKTEVIGRALYAEERRDK